MAEETEGIPVVSTVSAGPGRSGGPAHGVRYPWGDWVARLVADGELTLAAGRDYRTTSAGMGSTVRAAAVRHGLRVSVEVSDGRVTARVVPGEG